MTAAAGAPVVITGLGALTPLGPDVPALEEGQVRRGDPVLLLGFGAGLTAAGQVVRCP